MKTGIKSSFGSILIINKLFDMKPRQLFKISSIFVFILMFCNCSSSDDSSGGNGGEYYIDFTINGTNKHYSLIVGAEEQYVDFADMYGLTISGVANTAISNPTEVESIEILLFSPSSISEGEYTSAYYDGTVQFGTKIGYLASSNSETNVYSSTVNLDISTTAWATVEVTERTDTYIKGTFNASLFEVYDENEPPAITHVIENGAFKVPFSNN